MTHHEFMGHVGFNKGRLGLTRFRAALCGTARDGSTSRFGSGATQPGDVTPARLWIVLCLNLALVAGLVVVGAVAHSFAVLAEGGDFLWSTP